MQKYLKSQNRKNKQKRGFTLVELILYLAIVSVIFSALIPFSWNVIEGGVKSGIQQEVASNAWLMMEKIKSKVRNAENFSVAGNSLTISNYGGGTTVIQINGNDLQMTEAAETVNLNSAGISVSDFLVTDLSSGDGKTRQVQIRFTLNSASNQSRQEYRDSVSLESSVEVRGI